MKKAFEKIVGKGNQHFLPFLQCFFLPLPEMQSSIYTVFVI